MVPLEPTDVSDMAALLSQPRLCSRNGMTERMVDTEMCLRRLSSALETRSTFGLQTWKVLANDGTLLGLSGFSVMEETSEVNLTYCFSEHALKVDPKIAHDICKDVIDVFFDSTYFTHLVCLARRGDEKLAAHLKELEFSFRETRQIAGETVDVYQVLSPIVAGYLKAG
nr:GNAT family N-acetyltransferase [Roseibium hamelinense]